MCNRFYAACSSGDCFKNLSVELHKGKDCNNLGKKATEWVKFKTWQGIYKTKYYVKDVRSELLFTVFHKKVKELQNIQMGAVLKQTKENAFIHHIIVVLIASGWRPKIDSRKGLDESLEERFINEF